AQTARRRNEMDPQARARTAAPARDRAAPEERLRHAHRPLAARRPLRLRPHRRAPAPRHRFRRTQSPRTHGRQIRREAFSVELLGAVRVAEKMKLLVLNYEFPPLGGGAGNATACLTREWAARGHEVEILT